MGIKPKGPRFLLHQTFTWCPVWSIIAFCMSKVIAFYFSTIFLSMHVEFVLVPHFELGVTFLELGTTFWNCFHQSGYNPTWLFVSTNSSCQRMNRVDQLKLSPNEQFSSLSPNDQYIRWGTGFCQCYHNTDLFKSAITLLARDFLHKFKVNKCNKFPVHALT